MQLQKACSLCLGMRWRVSQYSLNIGGCSIRATSCFVALPQCSALSPLSQRVACAGLVARKHAARNRLGCVLCVSSAALSAADAPSQRKLVKICGITSEADAEVAAAAGADLLGVIMWQRGRRAVSPATAHGIAEVAHRHGIQVLLHP